MSDLHKVMPEMFHCTDLEERVLVLKSKTTGSLSYTAQKITDKIIDELVLTVFTELIDSNILWIDFLVFFPKI